MTINPGGRLELTDIVGRLKEIDRYWLVLARQSLVLGGERRLGKTHVARKMHEEGRDGFVSFFQELEKVHGVIELVRSVYAAVRDHLPRTKKLKAKAIELWDAVLPKRYGDLQLPDARANWKGLLTTAIGDVLGAIETDHKVVLIWDELPLMLYNVVEREGAATAIELLDLLRHLRQVHGARLRFFFNGSIGLHLVLRSLRAAGHANAPINDMQIETLPPMTRDEAMEVTKRALVSLTHPPGDIEALAGLIVDEIAGYPYYLHHVADQFSMWERSPVEPDVGAVVGQLITADDDRANFAYFAQRIDTHYLKDEARVALAILDAIAGQEGPLSLVRIANLVRHSMPEVVDEAVRPLCHLLRQDHYLSLEENVGYDFRWKLLKRWWRANRL
jgi:hypothetical protein